MVSAASVALDAELAGHVARSDPFLTAVSTFSAKVALMTNKSVISVKINVKETDLDWVTIGVLPLGTPVTQNVALGSGVEHVTN